MRRMRDDTGFTLVELLAAVAILGVVVLPLTGGIILGLRTMNSTTSRYSASNDAQVLSRYLPPDVQSANTGNTSSLSACTGTSNRKVQLTVNTDGTGTRTIMYWLRGSTAARYELVRSVWDNGANCTMAQPTRTTVMARNIANPTSDVTATPLSGTPMGFRIRVAEAPAQNETTGYTFTVSARKRTTVS